jgi:drug/metabolite transporter (DMT)-like permease
MNGVRTWNQTALVAGVVFVVLGVLFLLDQLDVLNLKAAYVLPVVLIVIGGVILVRVLVTSRRVGP